MTDTPTPDHTAQITGLAREVEALARTLVDIGATVENLATLPAQLQNMGNVVRQLAQEAAGRAGDDTPQAVTWLGFDGDTDTAENLLRHLADWLETVYRRWPDGDKGLPNCWMLHPWIVEELVTLWDAHRHAHSPRARALDRSDWCDRTRPGVARRVRQLVTSCSIETHLPDRGPRPPELRVVTDAAIRHVAQWWVNGDRTADGPANYTLWTEEPSGSDGRVW